MKTNDRFCRVVRSKQSKPLNMGCKKSLYYDTKMCCLDYGKWLMKEYCLMKEYVFCEAILRKFKNSNFRDYCICAIKTKKVDTKVISGVNYVVPRIDQEYKAVTLINNAEPMVQIQKASSGEEKIKELLENDDPEIMRMWNKDYGMINHPINVVENPAMEVDDVEVQIQEAAVEGSCVLEFENTMPEDNLPKEPTHLHQDCPFGVNEDRIASFVGLLSGCGNSAIRNNQVQIQEAPGEENGQLELNTFSHIQQPMIPDFVNVKSNITMPEIYDTLAEYMDVDALMNLNNELLIHPFDFSK
ncbi:hypothetical protein R3W88_011527 [Solanum pinnatisectum]|uniref:Uncharacterized protein n=1 Tax=Solanum pinnatisectum TaxID=50273 RepID=A0AAV9L911_9SOLN|nr:hypothetical protein R3W88_011527 [Solanum pinnatisectum]